MPKKTQKNQKKNNGLDSYRSASLKMLLHTPNLVRNKNLWLNNWKKPANPSLILKIYMNINMLKTLRRSAIKNPSNCVQWFFFSFSHHFKSQNL